MTTIAETTRLHSSEDEPSQAETERDWRRMTDVAHHNIAYRAYELYEERGREPGYDMDDWLKAEHDIELRGSTGRSLRKDDHKPS